MERSLESHVELHGRIRPATAWRLLVIVGAAVAVAAAMLAVTRTGLFRVRTIEVDGAVRIPRAEVVRLSEIDRHANAIWLDEGAAERALERDPRILRADVEISLPGTVQVHLQERIPVVAAAQGSRFLLLSGDGTVVGVSDRAEGLPVAMLPSIPRWEGPVPSIAGPARAVGALDVELRARVRRVLVSDDTLAFVLDDGLRVSYGAPESYEAKATALEEIVAWASANGESLRSIDVTAPSAPAVVPSG